MTFSPKQLSFMLNRVLEEQKKEINGPSNKELKMEWIRNTAIELINTLDKETQKFNLKYPANPISAADLIGAASTTLTLLIRNSGEKPDLS
jgi:hypothetical protein